MEYTDKQLKAWMAQFGELHEITVEDKSCIIRKPNRKDLSYASTLKDPIKISETLLNQLWVAGDEEMRNDDNYFLSAVGTLEEVLKVKTAEIKKL